MSGPTGGRAATVLGLAAAIGLALSACTSGAGSPGTLPAATPQPSPSATLSSSPSASARTGTEQQEIEAAVVAFVDAINLAVATGSTEAYIGLTTPTCTCRALVASVQRRADHGQVVKGGVWKVTKVNASPPSPTGRSVVVLDFTEGEFKVVDSGGHVVDSGAARNSSSVVVVARKGDGWVVTDVDAA